MVIFTKSYETESLFLIGLLTGLENLISRKHSKPCITQHIYKLYLLFDKKVLVFTANWGETRSIGNVKGNRATLPH